MKHYQHEHDIILDEWLVICCRDGDIEMASLLVQRWHPRLARYALRLTGGDRDAAADAVQEAWVAIMQGIRGIRDPAAFPAWAYSITRRKAADWVRQRQRQRERQREQQRSDQRQGHVGNLASGASVSMDRGSPPEGPAHSRTPSDTEASPEANFDASDERSALHRAIADLPADQRELLMLYYIDGFGVQEIARILDVQPGTVKSRLFRTRAALRDMLEKEG
ncbi:MAG: RNA polymerase sigma factor [Planctomycetota bacterium]